MNSRGANSPTPPLTSRTAARATRARRRPRASNMDRLPSSTRRVTVAPPGARGNGPAMPRVCARDVSPRPTLALRRVGRKRPSGGAMASEGSAPAGPGGLDSASVAEDELLASTNDELDALFRRSPVGPVPEGVLDGVALL